MIHGSLFSGIGGFDLAADWMGWRTILQVENDQFCQQVLQYYWPDADLHGDIQKTDFSSYAGKVDILSGGFPCQPYSTAGKRKGTNDERDQWPEMLRAVQEIKPRFVVGENVPGLLSWSQGMVFEQVCADLEAEGYEVQPLLLPAAGLNAPHRRERTWFVAHANNPEYKEWGKFTERQQYRTRRPSRGEPASFGISSNAAYAQRQERKKRPSAENAQDSAETGTGLDNRTKRSGNAGYAPNTTGAGTRQDHGRGEPRQPNKKGVGNHWQNFPAEPPVCGGDDGLPAQLDGITFSKWRKGSIKAYGNAIVPQVAYQLFRAIEETIESS